MTERELHELACVAFTELRGLPSDERAVHLDRLARTDPRLSDEVRSLLAFDTDPSGEEPDTADAGGPLPARIGPYRVVGRLGSGGGGFVLLAEQDEPVRRRVAVKVVPYAAVNPESAARFDFERRALERTDHPNIARILDAGRTPDGLPYLVMDLVDGPPITEFCRRAGSGPRDCVRLMLGVVDAVQHAHQRGVIHRDLKPGNILVAEVDAVPTPRVLDFGIAKPVALGDGDAPATRGLPVGTPAYMAPEQTGAGPVDTRADVYALGAVLYELVRGRPPIDVGGDPLDALRRIREQTPAPASRGRPTERGGAAPRAFTQDLDRVLARCLEKDPARRYATAAELGEDLRRLLRREPVSAGPSTRVYRLARFVERRKALTASVAVAALAIVVGVAGLSAGLIAARHQRREAIIQSEALREVNRFLTEDLLAAASPDQSGIDTPAVDLLRRAGERVDRRLGGRPLVAAAVHHALGIASMELGAFDDAERHLTSAVALRRTHAGPDAADTVRAEVAAASLVARRQDLPGAHAALTAVVDRARRFLGSDDPVLYSALNDLGVVSEALDLGPQAVAALTEALAGRVRLLGDRDPHVLVTLSNLAQAYDRVGDTERSLGVTIDALRIVEASESPSTMLLLGLNNNIGATLQDLNRSPEAAPYLRRAAALAAEWLGPDDPNTMTIQANLAGLEAKIGNPVASIELYDGVIGRLGRALGPDAVDTLTARYGRCNALWLASDFTSAAADYAVLFTDTARVLGPDHWLTIQTECSFARALCDAGRPAEAAPHAGNAAAAFLALYGPEHPRTVNALALAEQVRSLLAPAVAP